MVRGSGSAPVETDVKATTRPNTIRIRMRRGPLGDNLDDLSTMTINVGGQIFIALSRQSVRAAASNGFRSRHTAPTAVALASSPGSPSDRKSTRLNSSHLGISYAVFC